MNALVVAGTLLAVVLGLAVSYQGYRAYRRQHSRPMLFTAIGFLFLAVGSALDCAVLGAVNVAAPLSGVVRTCVLVTGMAFVFHSVYR
jgi:hypothetical protein